ncbi:trigger factor [Nitrosomonas aestuarii]|uniref:Trigger factor n=1 Tax=Nitrosomonas aestuarii TaxID=52441 RepID=A0A1I4CF99_9PROT|nr:trigger factor [Nitrosomonas aestuarii]SFK78826.1 trigger factor [Nitrosomonas aestuarii]
MRSNVESLGALERRIDISISQDQIQDEVNKRLKQLAKKTKMHGFRPGKVPLKLVSQRYGAEIEQEVLGDALQREFSEAVKEHDLQVVGYPRYEAKQDNEDPEQIAFSAQFEIYPEIVLGDLSQQTVEKPKTQVSTDDVDKTIEMIRKQQAQFQESEHAVMDGDRVKLDYHGKLNGNDFEGGQAEDVVLIVGEGKFMKDFEAALVGLNAGEEKSFDVVFPEDYHGKEVAGKSVVFEVKLKLVESPVLPEVNEEFAKLLGIQDGDLDKMRDGIRHDLEREVLKRINSRLKEQAMRCLMDTTSIDAPNALINKEIERLMENMHKDFASRGMNAKDMQLKPEMFKSKAEHRIKLGLILAELLKVHNLKATPEQIRKVIEDTAQSYDNPEEVVKWHYASKERLQDAESLALEENVVQWVLQQVSVVEKSVTFDELMGVA